MAKRQGWAIAAIAFAILSSSAYPESVSDLSAVMTRYTARDEGDHVRRHATITMRDKDGRERRREALICRKFFGADKRTVFFFLTPGTARGTGFLTFDYADPLREDDQWLYLPNVRKTRRISDSHRGDFFLGTDFTYEEIKKETKVATEDFDFKFLGTEMLDGHRCVKIEATPINEALVKELGYARAVHWFDAQSLMSHLTEYSDEHGQLLRSIRTSEIEQIDGIWTPTRIVAKNEITGHSTELRFSNITYNTPIDDRMFTEQALLLGPRWH